MEFTTDNVIQSLNISFRDSNQFNQNEFAQANDYIIKWTISDSAAPISIQILADDAVTDDRIKFCAASLLKSKIPILWGQYSADLRNSVRTTIYTIYENSPSLNLNVSLLIDCLAEITLFEFPQEWPEIGQVLFGDFTNVDEAKAPLVFRLIGSVIRSLDMPEYITPTRQQFLKNYFLDNIMILYNHIGICFKSEQLVEYGLWIFNGIFQWASFQQISPSINLLNLLCFQFIYNDATRKASIECLTTLFHGRVDALSFVALAPLVIHSLGSPMSLNENQQHITIDRDILTLLMRILTRFLSMITQIYDNSGRMIERTATILKALAEVQLTPDVLRESIIHTLQIILSIHDAEQINESYWTLWITIFHCIISEQKMSSLSKPTLQFMQPLFPQIRQSIYECVPLDQADDPPIVTCSNRSRTAWSLITMIDPQGMMAFLKEQTPSVALCYAIGNLEYCSSSQFNISDLGSAIIEIYSYSGSTSSPEFLVALLYCFSHSLNTNNGQLFTSFFEFALKCVNEEQGPVPTAATNALYYASRRQRNSFLNEQYVALLCENSENYLRCLERDNAVRMYKIATNLACKSPSQKKISEFYSCLTTPLLNDLRANTNLPTVFECIKEGSYSAEDTSVLFMQPLWQILLEITGQILQMPCSMEILEGALDAVAAGIINEKFNNERFTWILDSMAQRPVVEDCFFSFIRLVRAALPPVNAMLPQFIASFIMPALRVEQPNYAPIMDMLYHFQFQLFDFDWFVEFSTKAIMSYGKDDTAQALRCLANVIARLTPQNFWQVMSVALPPIFSALFRAMTDMMHKDAMQSIIQFLKTVMNQAGKMQCLNDAFLTMLLNGIKSSIEEPQEGMFQQFVVCLKEILILNKPFLFNKTIMDFLILLRKISPSDTDAFVTKENNTMDDGLLAGGGKVISIKDGEFFETSIPVRRTLFIKKKVE